MTDVYEDYITTEYHRRNMQVARVCGANAAVDQALERALKVKSIPVWLIAYLESAAHRLPGLQHDLAAWRDLAPDSPYIDKTATDTDALRAAEDRGIQIGLRAAGSFIECAPDARQSDHASAIRDLTPADATAALAARDAAMIARGMREAAEEIQSLQAQNPRASGQGWWEVAARAILARAAEIEGDARITCTGQQSPIE